MIEKVCGIYKIENILKGLVYVGSSFDIKRRWTWHKAKLKKNEFAYEDFQKDYNESSENIKFEILEEIFVDDYTYDELLKVLAEKEQWYFWYCELVGWTLVNKNKKVSKHKGKVKDISNFKKAQKGEGNGNSRLTKEKAGEIKYLVRNNDNLTQKEIANLYDVSQTLVHNIKHGLRWKYVREVKVDIA